MEGGQQEIRDGELARGADGGGPVVVLEARGQVHQYLHLRRDAHLRHLQRGRHVDALPRQEARRAHPHHRGQVQRAAPPVNRVKLRVQQLDGDNGAALGMLIHLEGESGQELHVQQLQLVPSAFVHAVANDGARRHAPEEQLCGQIPAAQHLVHGRVLWILRQQQGGALVGAHRQAGRVGAHLDVHVVAGPLVPHGLRRGDAGGGAL
mmetsp:Transcript_38110/g.71460  ORF Transcript_38110/g.71460 Transcript_38110/m.71460 type:complete len:207 (-) Transcript_38110:246-866(-)